MNIQLTVDHNGKPNGFASLPQLPDFGQLWRFGSVVYIVSQNDVSKGVIQYEPFDPLKHDNWIRGRT